MLIIFPVAFVVFILAIFAITAPDKAVSLKSCGTDRHKGDLYVTRSGKRVFQCRKCVHRVEL